MTTLNPGDIAIISYNSEKSTPTGNNVSMDGFSFVLFRDISAGTVIKFTDTEWVGGNFDPLEGAISFTAGSNLTKGSVVRIEFTVTGGAMTQSAVLGSGGTAGTVAQQVDTAYFTDPTLGARTMAISSSGDQIIAYQGTASASGTTVTPITAFTNRDAGFSGTAGESAVPRGLTLGVNAFVHRDYSGATPNEFDNGYYRGPSTGTEAFLRNAIYTESNWSGSNDPIDFNLSPDAFTFGSVATPADINVIGRSRDIVDGDTTPTTEDDTDFGPVDVASGSVVHTFTIANRGGTVLNLSDVSVSGLHSSEFSILTPVPTSVPAGGLATFQVRFNPNAGGERFAKIEVESDDPDTVIFDFEIRGIGARPPGDGTTLAAGDIAFVGFDSTADDRFAFVLLKDVVAGSVIKFTDAGWDGTTFRNGHEGAVQWVAPRDMSVGDVVEYDSSLPNGGPNFAQITEGGFFPSQLSLSVSGDQIIAYQGDVTAAGTNITNIAALQFDNPTFDPGASSNSETALPTGLSLGTDALAFGTPTGSNFLQGAWIPTPQPDAPSMLAAINNPNNWTGSASSASPLPFPSGTISFGPSAPEVDVTGQGFVIVSGDTTPSATDDTAFGAVELTGGSETHTFTIRNTGGADLTIGTITLSATPASQFTLTQPGTTTLSAGTSTTFQVTFDPSVAGLSEAVITIPTNDADEASYSFEVHGSGRAPAGGTALSAGSIAFTGFNSVTPEQFTFVLLEDVVAGTSIKFTDAGWNGTSFRSGFEGAVEWIAPTDMAAGEVVLYELAALDDGSNFHRIDDAGYFGSSLGLGSSGDQIIAFQGTATAAGTGITNLAAIQFDKSEFDTTFGNNSSSTLVPSGLTDGVNAVSVGAAASGPNSEFKSAVYTGPILGTLAAMRTALADDTNWTGANTFQPLPTTPIRSNANPTATGLPTTLTAIEARASDVDLSAFVISDADASGGMSLTITAGDGTLSGVSAGGVSAALTNANQTLTLTGTLADLNTYLATPANIQYTGAQNDTGIGADSLSVSLNDLDGSGQVPVGSVALNITEVDNAPTLTATGTNPTASSASPADLFGSISSSTADSGQTFTSLTLTVSNLIDGADETLMIDGATVALTNGTNIASTPTNGLGVSVSVAGTTATVSLTGGSLSEAALQTLVDDLAYINTSANPTASGDRVVTLTQLVDSGSNTSPNENTANLGISSTISVVEQQSLIVTTAADVDDQFDGLTSLREAIKFANANPGADTISFNLAPGSKIDLASDLPSLTSDITIDGDVNGDNIADITLDGQRAFSIFRIERISYPGPDIHLYSLNFQNGYSSYNGGAVEILDASDADVSISDSTFTKNEASHAGGAIYLARHSTLDVQRSTFEGNIATNGGGVLSAGFSTFKNTTFVKNEALRQGSAVQTGIDPRDGAEAQLYNVTLFDNLGSSGIYTNSSGGSTNPNITLIYDSVLLGQRGGVDVDMMTMVFSDQESLYNNSIPGLSASDVFDPAGLADNGGTVKTVALLADSANPALDAAAAASLLTDATGNPRNVDLPGINNSGTMDLGAYELQFLGQLSLTINDAQIYENGGTTTGTVSRTGPTSSAATVTLMSSDTGEATVTATVTIPAGATSASFTISGVDDGVNDGPQTVTISADAPFYTGTAGSVLVKENQPPTLALNPATITLPENADTTQRIKLADVIISDDGRGTNLLSLTGNISPFELDGTELFLAAGMTLDFETKPVLSVFIDVDDPGIGTTREDRVEFSLRLTDVNEAPEVVAEDLVLALPENADTSAPIKLANLTILDDALGTNTLTVSGANADLFTIVDNELFLKAGTSLDFETMPTLDVTVNVDDAGVGGSPDHSVDLSFEVTDVNDAPALEIVPYGNGIAETPYLGTLQKVADVVIHDDALGTNILGLAGANAFLFELRGTELFIRGGQRLDFETQNPMEVTVTLDDPNLGTGVEATATAVLRLLDVNEAPTLALENVLAQLPEDTNTTSPIKIADIIVTDDALGTNTLALTGANADLFEITGNAVFLKAGAALDHETAPQLDVTITLDDPEFAGLQGSQAVQLAIGDVNEPPEVGLQNTLTVLPEDADTSARIKVADIVITDDGSGVNVLDLTGEDAALFEIDGTELFLIAGAALDFESNPSLDVAVTVDDLVPDNGPDGSASLSISVSDVNEAPTLTLENIVSAIPESTTARTKVADIVITDDALGTNTLALAGGDAALFEIDGNALYLSAGAALDFESQTHLDVTVTLDDPTLEGLEGSESVVLGITDVNEAPSVALLNSITTLSENTTTRTKVADIAITDDALGAANLSLTGTDAALFEIDGTELFLMAGATLDFETNASLNVSVVVDDPALAPDPNDSAALQIALSDVNEAPGLSVTQIIAHMPEGTNTATRTAVADIVITDDALGTNTLGLTGEDAALFEIDNGTLYLRAGITLDHDANPSLDVAVTLDDATLGTGPEASIDIAVNVPNSRQTGTPGDDLLIGTPFPDVLEGLAGNDTLVGSGKDDTLDGGSGSDTAVLSSPHESYTLTFSPDGTLITDRREGGTGTDTLISIENLLFSSDPNTAPTSGTSLQLTEFAGVLDASAEDLEGLTQLYIGLFARVPDVKGLLFYATALAGGATLETIAQSFLSSDEAVAVFGSAPSSTQIVEAAYRNLLDRTPDAPGAAFWSNQIDEGHITTSEFFTLFSKGAASGSDDHQTLTDQTDIGLYFSAIQGLSNTTNATAALDAYDTANRETSLQNAQNLIDGFVNEVENGTNPTLLIRVEGLIDDPFAIA